MKKYVLSAAAEADLNAIWEYIAEDNVDAADRWIDKLFDAFEAVGQNPNMGHRREDLTLFPVLFWPVAAYLVIYRVQGRSIEVVAVIHGARDIPLFLAQRTACKKPGEISRGEAGETPHPRPPLSPLEQICGMFLCGDALELRQRLL
ncbi:MAG: type II toxin-antitoxin system RelE/ParE family toxin [Acidobacteriaceae bacterium]